jgi:methylmalonyl-CoA mutase N-terminal domain/subunit
MRGYTKMLEPIWFSKSYMLWRTQMNISIPIINKPIVFEVSVGTNYFFEIAKLRAFHFLI